MARRALSCAVLLSALGAGCGGPADSGPADAAPGATAGLSAACRALRPAFGTPVDLRFDTGTHSTCWAATSSPAGEVALGFTENPGPFFELFTPAGAPAMDPGVFAIRSIAALMTNLELDPALHSAATGWQGLAVQPFPTFFTWSAGGSPSASLALHADVSAPTAQGGSVVAGTSLTVPGERHLIWVNGAGAVTRDVRIDRTPDLLLVNWGSGDVLVVVHGGTFPTFTTANARWYGPTGAPLTPWFTTHTTIAPTSGNPRLHLLRDGRVALSSGGVWTVAIHDASTAVDHAPAWLASRPGTRLATIPGGYAVLTDGPSAISAGPAAKLELLDAAGKSCGTQTPPPGPVPAGATRTTSSYFVGQDGTLIESSSLTAPSDAVLGMGIHCAFRWWPRHWR